MAALCRGLRVIKQRSGDQPKEEAMCLRKTVIYPTEFHWVTEVGACLGLGHGFEGTVVAPGLLTRPGAV